MVLPCLRNTGKIPVTLFIIFVFYPAVLFSAGLSSSLDRTRISMYENATLNIIINRDRSDIETRYVPDVEGLEISETGSSHQMSIVNGNRSVTTAFFYSITPSRAGKFHIPSFRFYVDGEILETEEYELTVESLSSSTGQSRAVLPEMVLSSDRAYEGEPVIMRCYILISEAVKTEVLGFSGNLQAEGFLQKRIEEVVPDEAVKKGRQEFLKRHVATFALTPVQTGRLNVRGPELICITGEWRYSPFRSRKHRLEYPAKPVKVSPLPAKGRPADFKGTTGSFKLEVRNDKILAAAGESSSFNVRISGTGNLFFVSEPHITGWPQDRFSGDFHWERIKTEIHPGKDSLQGYVEFRASFIPANEGEIKSGKLFLNYYDPEKESYIKETAPLPELVVSKGDVTVNQCKEAGENNTDHNPGIFKRMFFSIFLFLVSAIALFVLAVIYFKFKHGRKYLKQEIEAEVIKESKVEAYSRRELTDIMLLTDKEEFSRRALSLIIELENTEGCGEDLIMVKEKLKQIRYARRPMSTEEMDGMKATLAGIKGRLISA